MATLDLKYTPPGPVARQFLESNAFVRGIRGPIGSGKSTACVFEILRRCAQQKRSSKTGKRRSRWAVIRNTYPELKTTTIKTWHEWMPDTFGHWVEQGPPTHYIETDDLEIEVLFLALDSPADIKKLLSLELTGVWINEAREVPKAILDACTGRVGRFPKMDEGGCTWAGVIMDTNAPEEEHWWAKLADFPEEEQEKNTREAERQLREMGALEDEQYLYEWFSQPGGRERDAENLANLPAGYYIKAMAGKKDDWIKVYVDNCYGFVQDGKPVIGEYRDNLHCRPFEFNPRLGLWVGIDFGLTPAATFGQQTIMGQWRIHSELATGDMGAVRFAQLLNGHIQRNYPEVPIHGIIGDPAGDIRAGTDETTPFQILKANGIDAKPAKTNDPSIRREAYIGPCTRLIDGEPGLLVHPNCKTLRKGLGGAWKYKRMLTVGRESFHDKPDKGIYSHICEAGEYMLLGGGEHRAIIKPKRSNIPRPDTADSDYNILG